MRVAAAMHRSMSMELMIGSEPVPLSVFIKKFSSNLPARVQVTNGFCSSSTDLSISQNEQFCFHFIKHTRVVTLRDSQSEEEFSIPLNSSIRFGLLYDPHGKEEEAKAGYVFDTAGGIMVERELPWVVRATKTYRDTSAKMSVEANEILVIKDVTKGSKVRIPGVNRKAKLLRVYSVGSGEEKYLTEKCAGRFSTSPQDVRLHLSTMVKNDITFPQRAVMFPDSAIDKALSIGMVKHPVILERLKGETSVVATATTLESDCDSAFESSYPPTSTESEAVMDISSELDIQVQTQGLSEMERRELAERTSTLLDGLTTASLQLVAEKPNSRAYDLQSLLYQKTMADEPMYGIQLVRPPLLHASFSVNGIDSETSSRSSVFESQESSGNFQPQSLAFVRASTPNSSSQSASTDNLYTRIEASLLDVVESEYIDMRPESKPCSVSETCTPEGSVQSLERAYCDLKFQVDRLSSRSDELAARLNELTRSCVAKQEADSANAESILSTCRVMEGAIHELQTRVGSGPSPHLPGVREGFVSPTSASKPSPEENKQYLATLDCDQVQCLLDAMDLPQYKEIFQQEHISGDILLALDETILTTELNVGSHIHVIRLLKLIQGKESALSYLSSSEGRYVVFTH